jgi:hypothetical protein
VQTFKTTAQPTYKIIRAHNCRPHMSHHPAQPLFSPSQCYKSCNLKCIICPISWVHKDYSPDLLLTELISIDIIPNKDLVLLHWPPTPVLQIHHKYPTISYTNHSNLTQPFNNNSYLKIWWIIQHRGCQLSKSRRWLWRPRFLITVVNANDMISRTNSQP